MTSLVDTGIEAGSSFPVYSVAELEAIVHGAPCPEADVIAEGFAITEDDQTRTPLMRAIHPRHVAAARLALVHSGSMPTAVVRTEGKNFYDLHTPGHTDGLSGTYLQAHTTLPDNHAAVSRACVESYDLTDCEHLLLRALYDEGKGRHAGLQIRENAYKDGKMAGLNVVTKHRPPDATRTFDARWGVTLVFPNGYDARPDSSPSRLRVHTFQTGGEDPQAALQYRRVLLSRLQREEDSEWLDIPGRKWTFFPRLWRKRQTL